MKDKAEKTDKVSIPIIADIVNELNNQLGYPVKLTDRLDQPNPMSESYWISGGVILYRELNRLTKEVHNFKLLIDSRSIVNTVTLDEIRAIIGHEYGHLKHIQSTQYSEIEADIFSIQLGNNPIHLISGLLKNTLLQLIDSYGLEIIREREDKLNQFIFEDKANNTHPAVYTRSNILKVKHNDFMQLYNSLLEQYGIK